VLPVILGDDGLRRWPRVLTAASAGLWPVSLRFPGTRERHGGAATLQREKRAYGSFKKVKRNSTMEGWKDAIIANAIYYPVVEFSPRGHRRRFWVWRVPRNVTARDPGVLVDFIAIRSAFFVRSM